MGERIFCFGSNRAGIHGAGAAKHARLHHSAQWGIGDGRTGWAYAIPTKDHAIRTLPLEQIRPSVERFLDYARAHPELTFEVTAIGTGLAGYKPHQIAPMFAGAPSNCELPEGWRALIPKEMAPAPPPPSTSAP